MHISTTISDSGRTISKYRQQGLSIGLVPTMGALHEGHLTLVDRSGKENNKTIVSIFVNPTQFNEKQDFENYPRNFDLDIEILKKQECDLLFIPSVDEMYPKKDTRIFDLKGLDATMEGRIRPGHFNGVAQVVSKLFDILTPDRAYFGEKDFQQLTIIRYLTKSMKIPVEIVSCPILREADGLAMSSRNRLLTPDQRATAVAVPNALKQARKKYSTNSISAIKALVYKDISSVPGLNLEYFEIVDQDELTAIEDQSMTSNAVACIAVRIGNIRLIDNMKIS